MIRRRLLAGIAGSLVLGAVLLSAPASAQKASHDLQLRRVDSGNADSVNVAFEYDGASSGVNSLKVGENGKKVDAKVVSLADAKLTNGVVFVVDSSASTDKSATLAEARKAITALVKALPGVDVALVTAGKDVQTVSRFGSDANTFAKNLANLGPEGDGGLWEGVVRAASQFDDRPTTIPNIVLITDGNNDTANSTSRTAAAGAVNGVGAIVQAVAVRDEDGGLGDGVRSLAEGSGGSYQESNKASDVTQLVGNLKARLAGQYAFTFKSAGTPGVNDLTLEVGGTQIRNSFVSGSVAVGDKALEYQKPASTSGFTPLQNSLGKLLAVLLALGAAGLAAWALLNTLIRNTELSSALEPYSDSWLPASAQGDDDDEGGGSIAQTPLMQRAVALTEQLAESQGLLSKVEDSLERANMPLRAGEAMFSYLVASVIISLLAIALAKNVIAGLIALPLCILLAPTVLRIMADRRKKKFESQLPDMLQLMAGTLRAGYSMMQGVEAVSQEVSEPMGRELRRVVTEARLGRPLEEALEAVAVRMDSNDFAWATMAIRIQREVGGNLSELLMTVAETMTQRERLRRDVQTLTAEGRISAYVLGILPIGLGAVMYALNPDYMSKLTDSGLGWSLLGAAAAGMIAGFIWMNRIIKIEI
jgi:tight adherence protein B